MKYKTDEKTFFLAIPKSSDWYSSSVNFEFQSTLHSTNGSYYLATFNEPFDKLELATDEYMNSYATIICQRKLKCFNTSRSRNRDSLWLLRNIKSAFSDMFEQKIVEVKEAFKRINMASSFKSIFSSLWYATLPCVAIDGISSGGYGYMDTSVLKYCEWKGIPIDCASIFKPFPTDEGICCSFNIKSADEIFRAGIYSETMKKLQKDDNASHGQLSSVPEWYAKNKEPKTLPGKNKGLFLLLDAHSDWFAPTSQGKSFNSFTGVIGSNNSFPFMGQQSFEILTGHYTTISLGASRIDADDDLRSLDKSDRKCRFEDESSDLIIYQNYSYTNCMFECKILLANKELSCFPWYFPSYSSNITICDPWETQEFLLFMDTVDNEKCQKCLPECSTTIYESFGSANPFGACDLTNLEMSPLCKISDIDSPPNPKKFYSQVIEDSEVLSGIFFFK